MRDRGPAPANHLSDPRLFPYSPDAPTAALAASLGVGRIAKLDANELAFGPFPGVVEALVPVLEGANRYPDLGVALVEALCARHRIAPENVVVCHGADPIIGHLCQAFMPPGHEVITAAPSFVTYAQDALRHGGSATEIPVRPDGCLDLPAMLSAVGPRTSIVFLCNPNNPTGGYLPLEEVDAFLSALPEHVLAVVDQAYLEFTGDEPDVGAPLAVSRPNVCYLRTFSKIFGLAGLRVGYLVGPAPLVAAVGRLRHWYDVTDVAHAAATLSLAQPAELARRRTETNAARAALAAILQRHGLEPLPSTAGFLLAPADDAEAIVDGLAACGVLTRLVAAGSQRWIRIAVGDAEDRAQLADALAGLQAATATR